MDQNLPDINNFSLTDFGLLSSNEQITDKKTESYEKRNQFNFVNEPIYSPETYVTSSNSITTFDQPNCSYNNQISAYDNTSASLYQPNPYETGQSSLSSDSPQFTSEKDCSNKSKTKRVNRLKKKDYDQMTAEEREERVHKMERERASRYRQKERTREEQLTREKQQLITEKQNLEAMKGMLEKEAQMLFQEKECYLQKKHKI